MRVIKFAASVLGLSRKMVVYTAGRKAASRFTSSRREPTKALILSRSLSVLSRIFTSKPKMIWLT